MTRIIEGGWLDGQTVQRARKTYLCNHVSCDTTIVAGQFYALRQKDAGRSYISRFIKRRFCFVCAGPDATIVRLDNIPLVAKGHFKGCRVRQARTAHRCDNERCAETIPEKGLYVEGDAELDGKTERFCRNCAGLEAETAMVLEVLSR